MKNIGNEYFVTYVEIDTEIVDMLAEAAREDAASTAKLTWSKTLPVGVNNYCYFA